MSKVDIVLVKPGSQKALYGDLSDYQLTGLEPPLWGAILGGYLRGEGFNVLLLDSEAENLSYEGAARRIKDMDPLLCAVMVSGTNPSASTMNMTGAGEIVRNLKDIAPEIATLLGGLHPSALPERTLQEERPDYVCQGEGFYTLPDLIRALKDGESDPRVPGLWYERGGEVVSFERPADMKDLGALPMPAWDLLPMEVYRAHNWHCFDNIANRQPYGVLYTSLGCPFQCTFCCINALFAKHAIRYRDLDSVIDEVDVLVNTYGIRNLKIMDEMFAMNEKRVVDFCDRIIERGYDLNMWAYARVNTVTRPMLDKMKQAGINWAAYGFESGSKRVIQDVSKGYKTERVMDVVQMTYDAGVHICANYIFGLPEDDYESMDETLKLMLDINAEWANIYSAMAFPGSKLYDQALESGWKLPDTWQGFSQYSPDSMPLPTKYLTGGQVLSYRDYAFNAYHRNPRYLAMIRDKFGVDTMRHLQEMTKNDLDRKHALI